MADSDQSIPPWVPEIAPGVHADVYPVEPSRTSPEPYCNSPAELRLDRSAVTTGYSERRQAYEFASCLPASVSDAKPIPSAPLSSAVPSDASSVHLSSAHATGGLSVQDLSKIRGGLGMLRRSRPTKLQRVALQTFATPPLPSDPAASSLETPSFASKKSFPLQKPSASSSLEDWFNKLSSGASFSTSQLSRSVPLGPAIVRAAGKVIEMMATRSVPTQRAAWYIRIAVLNECVKQIRPDRPPPSPRSFWTRQLCMLLKTEIDAIRARKTAMLGSMDRVAFWDYVLDLARWQADEVLLDLPAWLSRIASILRTELQTSQSFASPGTKIALSAARRFLPEFLANAFSARQLCDALLPGAVAIAKVRRLPSPSSHVKGGAQRKVSAKRAASIANPCHAEVTTLLSAALYVLDEATGSAESGVRINDLEVLVKRTMQVLTPGENKQKVEVSAAKMEATLLAGSSDNGKAANYCAGQQEDNTISEHLIMREFEKIPSHGDVPRVTRKIHEAFKPRGGLRAAVKFVCEWAVEGPAGDRAEAILVGAAIVAQLAFENSRHTASLGLKRNADPSQMLGKPSAKIKSTASDAAWTPPLQREIWQFMKDRSEGRDLHNLGTTDHTVRFMAQLCRLEQLSLPVFVRDVSRLVSLGHAGCAYLVKCLSLLPDPADKSVADSRRSLLRKFGYLVVSQRSGQQQGFDEKVVDAACSGDMAIMEKEAEALLKSEKPGVILGTAETVRLEDLSTTFACSGLELSNRLYSISSFMIYIDEPGLAVEWVLDHLGEIVQGTGRWADQALVSKKGEAFLTLLRIVEDLARYVAACGQLDTIFHLMKKAWLSSWSTSAIRKAILYSQAAYAKMFSASSGNGSMYWTTLAARNLQQMALNWPSPNQLIPLVLANVRGQIVDRAAEETSVAEILSKSRTENLGPTPDQDLTYLKTQDCMYGLSVSEIRDGFAKTESTFAVNDYFLKGFTANDIFGSVFIPVMIGALNDPIEDASPEDFFSRLAAFAVQVIDAWQNDVRLQGVRPAIVVEFIALLIAGCLCGHSDTSNSLEMLVGMRWVWKILAPAAGIKLAQRLRDRVEHYCEKIGTVDKVVLSAMLFNMVTRFSGEASRDEATVASALGTEPLGMIEMQLSLLAAHRRECGEDEEFGARIADAAVSLISGDSARTLASTALLCCTHEESKHIVAGLVGYGAVRAMAESLGFVVKGLTVEASKNSSLHRERAGQWYQADIGRRGVLECIVESLSQEVGVQVETVLFDQLVTVTSQLSAAHSRNCMPSSLVEDGRRISDALESRLNCVLRSQRTAQASDVWIQRTIQVASLMRVAVPLMKSNAVSASLDVLKLCLKNLGECEKAEGKGTPAVESLSEVVERFDKNDLKGQLKSLLTPILFWVEESESTFICSLFGQRNSAHGREHAVRVLNADGGDIDRWVLLEGYGRGTDEDAAIHPSTFSRQGEGSAEGVEATPSVQLKRTYATFASLAV